MQTTKITMINKFDASKMTILDPRIVDNKFLVLDLWDNELRQIFLQINDINVAKTKNDLIRFDVTSRDDVTTSIKNIESECNNKLAEYMKKIGITNKFKLRENIVHDQTNKLIGLSVHNQDYNALLFDSTKNITDKQILRPNMVCNIIIELMQIELNISKYIFSVDIRLRLLVENIVVPPRIKLHDPSSFMDDTSNNVSSKVTELIGNTVNKMPTCEDIDYEDNKQDENSTERRDDTNINEDDTSDDDSLDNCNVPLFPNVPTNHMAFVQDMEPFLAMLSNVMLQKNDTKRNKK